LTQTTTSPPLERLFRLQEVLLEIRVKTERRAKTPDHLAHIEAAYQDSRTKRDEAERKLKEAEARKKALEGEVADWAEKLKKYQGQLAAVKTNREYGALLDEIDGVKREMRTREDEILSLEETLISVREQAASFDASFPEEEASFEEQMAEWRAEQAGLTAEIDRAAALVDVLRKDLDKKLLASFDRTARARAGVAVARVAMVGPQTAACSACNVRLRPQLLSDLRLSKETVHCESCKRILYWDGKSA